MKIKQNICRVKKTDSVFKRVISLALVLVMVVSSITIPYVVASPVLTITKSVDKTTPYVGESFFYTLKYADPSTTEDAYDVILEDILPSNIQYVAHVASSDVASVSVTNNGTNDVVRFIFKPVLAAGSTGVVKIEARFPAGTTLPGSAINSATIKPSNGVLVTSNQVTVTPKFIGGSDWSIAKTRIIPSSVLPAVGNNVTYRITVNGNSAIGGMNLKNVIITDTIPAGSTFVSASNGGTFNSGVVTWNIASLPVGTSQNLTVVINYPSPTFTVASSVTNNVIGNATQNDNTAATQKNASVTHGFAVPTYTLSTFSKGNRQSNDRYSVGQTARFTLSNIGNAGNSPIDRLEITDNIPVEIALTQISTGSYNSSTSVQIQYKTNLNATFRTWTGSPFASPSNTTLNVSALGLTGSEYVTQVKWTITDTASGQIQPGFANTAALSVNGIVSAPVSGNAIINTATLQGFYGANVLTLNASNTIYVAAPMPWLEPIKTVNNGQTRFNYNDTVTFNLRIKNHDFATGNYVNPIAADPVPPEFENITYVGWDAGNSGISAAPVINSAGTKVIGGKTYTMFTATFTGTLQPGQYVNVRYSAKIKDLTVTGLLTNSLYISTLNNSTVYQNDIADIITDTNDLDSDGSTTDRFVKSDANIFINFMGSLDARKQIKGADDLNFTYIRYPSYTYTYPGDYVNYRLVVKNTGSNGPITNVVLIDKLPTIGDTGVVDSSARNTQWTPYLVNLITGANGAALPAGVTVYYSTVVNPTCAELTTPQNHTNNPADLWSTTPPADITTVKSIKIDFGSLVLNTNDEFTLEWPMRAPVGAPLTQIAWNSFGYSATYPDLAPNGTTVIQSAFLPSEPIKVGFEIKLPPPFAAGNFVWEDTDKDGIQDAGEIGINNVLVNLYQKVGSNYVLYDYTRTGNDQLGNPGYYNFPVINLGTYRMEFVYPKTYTDTNGYTSTYSPSPYLVGADRTIDSNGNPTTITNYTDLGIVKNSILTPDFAISTADDMSIDLGLYRLCSIGDYVWYDYNADGLQTGESGLTGVTVTLLDSAGAQAMYGNGTLVPTQTTTATGAYLFTGLEPGVYKVRFSIPSDYKLSTANVGANDAIDSDAIKDVGATATTGNYTLLSGTQNLTVDVGMYLGHIGNLVFNDLAADGIFNGSDAGISGVTVRLYKDGNPVAYKTTTTNGSGIYSFDDLPPGTYVVEVVRNGTYLSNGKFTVTSGTTPLVNNDSDVDRSTGRTSNIILAAGDRIDTIDAGMYRFGSIGDRVWNDRNANGTQDGGEPNISGVTVRLTDAAGNPVTNGFGVVVADTTTNASGIYSFPNLEPGNYRVVFFNPGQFYSLSPNNGLVTVTNNSDGTTVGNVLSTTTGIITLTSNQTITYVDQGMYLGALGDFVWDDLNANGRQDSGELGIPGVTVRLLDAGTLLQATDVNGVLIADKITTAAGAYRFDDLKAGSYVVQFSMPTGWDKATPRFAAIATTATDSNADVTTYRSDTVTLTAGQRDFTIDAGFYGYARLGDFIWNDLDADGVQDVGEPGIVGATVNLLDSGGAVIGTTTTIAGGAYTFTNLIPGTYAIQAVMPTGFDRATLRYQGATTTDSNLDTTTLKSENVTLISRQNNTTLDGGFYKYASIGDYVWEDVNGNGIQDTGEPALNGVTVNLWNGSGTTQLSTTTTNASGFYTFTSLVPGAYIIEVVKPAAYSGVTLKTQGSDTAKDSNLNPATARSDATTLISGENNMTVDAGLYRPASLGDFVWYDTNADGIQDAGEVGIPNVTVRLLNSSGTLITSTTTNASGAYSFTNLAPAGYFVEVVKPSGYVSSPKNAGSDITKDSNIIFATSRSDLVTLISGENNPTIDAGLHQLASLGDFVWNDLNANGIQDVGEPGIPGATVNLINSLGVQISSTTTNASGFYSFAGLVPGLSNPYTISVVKPTGYDNLSAKAAGGDTAKDSNLNVNLKSDPVTLVSNENNITIDAGFYKLASLGDFVWDDLNANGIQDTGEVGVQNVTVRLLDSGGGLITTATTDVNGGYLFTGLIPGSYFVEVVKPSGYFSSPKTAGGDISKDSNMNIATSRSDSITLISGEINQTIDAGIYKLASIGDYIWEDVNGNGVQNVGEPAIAGVTVRLLDNGGSQVASTVTNASGFYTFTDLIPGTYTIEVVKPAAYDGVTLRFQGSTATDSNINPTTWRSDATTLISGQNNMTVDGGLYKFASLGDFVWYDTNGDGIQDAGEVGIANVTVRLLNSSGTLITSTTTNASGAYSFTGLAPAGYIIEIVKPSDYFLSPKNAGSDIAKDSNIIVATSRSDVVTLISGENNPTIDAGLHQLASLGDYVWNDLNANGIQDAGEIGIPGATVNLINNLGVQVATTSTNASGLYSFTGLIPGMPYTVAVVKPVGYDNLSPKFAGSDTAKDSNLNADLKSDPITLISNENNITIDAGFYKLASLGDFVWDDLNANGIQDTGEIGVPNVTVRLLDSGGGLITTITTDVNGGYLFTSLVPGSYFVEVVKPSGYFSSPKIAGSDTAKDSNMNIATSRSDAVTLISGEINQTIDAGIYKLASLGDYVWDDLNFNGIQDAGETGISGTPVHLLNSAGVQIDSTLTNASGFYSFTNLTPGTYSVEVPMPTGFGVLTAKAAGSNVAVDSNLNTNFKSDPLILISGENNPTIDAGFCIFASLSDFAWDDLNEDGIQDTGEPGMPGVVINLLNQAGVQIATATTDSNGKYIFSDLIPGFYSISVVKPSGYILSPQMAGSDTTKDSNIDIITNKSDVVFLHSGENNTTYDVGVRLARPTVDIQKYVSFDEGLSWFDADTAPGPQYIPDEYPDPVFKFVVTNIGNVTLTDIVVTDDVFGNIGTVSQLAPGEVWESSLTTQNYNINDLNPTGPIDWIDNQNVSLNETSSPKKWDFSAFPTNPHTEGTWIVNGNYWNTGYYYYCGVIQPGESVHLPLSVLLDDELTTNDYQGATFYLQSKYDSIQITNEAVYDAWNMGFLPDINKWLPTAYSNTNQRWEASDVEVVPVKKYFWNMIHDLWEIVV